MNATSVIDISEAEMVSGLLNNDQECFSGIYDLHAAKLLGMIMKWVKEDTKAEMLLHNAFVKAWGDRKLFDPANGSIYYWLCRYARICYNEDVELGFCKQLQALQ